jgi:hypothetical protein
MTSSPLLKFLRLNLSLFRDCEHSGHGSMEMLSASVGRVCCVVRPNDGSQRSDVNSLIIFTSHDCSCRDLRGSRPACGLSLLAKGQQRNLSSTKSR